MSRLRGRGKNSFPTLIQHVDPPAECTPRPTIRTVEMASSVDIRASLVQRSVDDEASRINRLVRTTDTIALLIDVHHI